VLYPGVVVPPPTPFPCPVPKSFYLDDLPSELTLGCPADGPFIPAPKPDSYVVKFICLGGPP
tara:strand:- start:603 stop:788 length:186 start_codon:yes stop_codon:yes gene_type:complete